MSESQQSVIGISPNRRAWQRFLENKPAVWSGLFLGTLVLTVLVWPWVASELAVFHSPEEHSEAQFSAPHAAHWFGTDVHGRDLLSRIVYGTGISVLVGMVGAGVSLVIGVMWGAIAGWFGGRTDSVLMRTVDVLYSLPSIIFVIVLITTLEEAFRDWLAESFESSLGESARMLLLFAGLGAVSWLTMARIVRGQILSLKEQPFIEACRALGMGPLHILFRHLLPNVVGVVVVYLTLTIPSVILYESFLSYLGLGIQPPQASLGSLIAEGAAQINPVRIYWWMIVFPAGMLALILMALNFFGDGMRDAFDLHGDEKG